MKNVVCNLAPTHDFHNDEAVPDVRQAWKFVIIVTPEASHLVAGPVSVYPYHAHLVDQFCIRHEIPSAWVKKPDFVEVLDPDVTVRGGGHILIDLAGRRMRIYGRSTAYGGFQPADLEQGLLSDAFFHGFEVETVGGQR
jgi:hypothetical protein